MREWNKEICCLSFCIVILKLFVQIVKRRYRNSPLNEITHGSRRSLSASEADAIDNQRSKGQEHRRNGYNNYTGCVCQSTKRKHVIRKYQIYSI